MVAAQGGDQAAYRALLTELGEAIEAYLIRHFGRSPFTEDCVQESLLAVHTARHTYDPSRLFRPWLYAIVRHKSIDCLRRMNRSDRTAKAMASEGRLPDVDLDVTAELGGCLERLSEVHRQALLLTKLHGYSVAEAASLARVSESAMKVRVHRGLKRLKRLLEELDDELA